MSTHLYRSRDDRMLAGVAGGLAELWDADPSLVRIIWALLVVLTGGIALVVYIVMAIVVPEDDGVRSWSSGSTWNAAPPSVATAPAAAVPSPDGASDAPGASPNAPGVAGADWPASRLEAREMRREARRAAREARRANRRNDGRSGAIVVGVLFILVGAWYLVREYLPTIDWDWFWPLVLVAVGVLVLVLAVRPRDEPASPDHQDGGRR